MSTVQPTEPCAVTPRMSMFLLALLLRPPRRWHQESAETSNEFGNIIFFNGETLKQWTWIQAYLNSPRVSLPDRRRTRGLNSAANRTMDSCSSNVHVSVGSAVETTLSVNLTSPRVTQNWSLDHSLTGPLKYSSVMALLLNPGVVEKKQKNLDRIYIKITQCQQCSQQNHGQ